MLLLCYFDRIIGPKVFITYPSNLKEDLDAESLNQIMSLLDSADNGFFTHYFSDLNTANFIFTIKSSWARGRQELIMITAIISEDEPDYTYYERFLTKFIKKIQKIPFIFKAFYLNAGPKDENDEILENYKILKEEIENLYKILSVKKIETEGQLITFENLKQKKKIDLSSDVIKKLESITEKKKNCFLVFRARGDAMKINIITLPRETNKIIRITFIFGEQMTVTVLQEISEIFTRFEDKVSLIFTSGICQEVDKCIYEAYIDTDIDILNEMIEQAYKISGILEIEVKLIGLKS
ncbi:MAG: hypothetical protein ACTSQG_03885 [Promethearchaeota archaeon]